MSQGLARFFPNAPGAELRTKTTERTAPPAIEERCFHDPNDVAASVEQARAEAYYCVKIYGNCYRQAITGKVEP